MARGWESKSVEDQISEREAESQKKGQETLTPLQMERRAKREGLMLARARTLHSIETTRDARYRALLDRTLAHLDSQLAELESKDSGS